MAPEKLAILQTIFPFIAIMASLGIGGWVVTTWLRIKNGYPLDGAWGQSVYPRKDAETTERVKLLSQENARLAAELGSVKDRLANVERIVTDDAHRLAQDIEQLRVAAPAGSTRQ